MSVHVNTSGTAASRRPSYGEIALPAVLLLVGLYVAYVGVSDVRAHDDGGLSSGMMPAIAGGGLVLVSAALLLRPSTYRSGGDGGGREGEPRAKPWVVLLILLGAAFLIEILGFALTMGLLTYALIALVERSASQVRALVIGAAVGLFTWAVFDLFIGVPLPGGVLFTG